MQSLQKAEKAASDSELELKKMDSKSARIQKDQKDSSKLVEQLLKQYPWIATEKQYDKDITIFVLTQLIIKYIWTLINSVILLLAIDCNTQICDLSYPTHREIFQFVFRFFGQSGSDFDFSARNPREVKERMQVCLIIATLNSGHQIYLLNSDMYQSHFIKCNIFDRNWMKSKRYYQSP